MLREVNRVSQVPGAPHRRWFADEKLDLNVWTSPEGTIVGIQLCYEKGTPRERALTWFKDREFSHMRVDDGEGEPGRFKMSPILVRDEAFDPDALLGVFERASRDLDEIVSRAVCDVIRRYAQESANSPRARA